MNLFELFVKIGVDDQASKKLSDISGKLGKGLKTASEIGVAAVGVAAAGITALTTAAVNNYSEYEQLVGGAELLFGNAFSFVQKKSSEAYKSVQMSQNEYLQQVNGFATGLKTALEGNELAAAELADRIITAEADIVAATGNSQEAVQNAFNGIMKSNYTMLDNLQLGITPTKEGFQEVIDKVNDYKASIGEATNYQIDNLADAQSALLDYIEMQGLSGYASMEAANTISGSVASMKSAWQNLLTGLADGNANIEDLVNNLIETVVGNGTESNLGVLGNILPAVETALNGASKLVSKALPKIMDLIPKIINDNLPVFAEAAIGIVQSIVDGISQNQEMLAVTALETITYLANSLISMLPKIVALGLDLIISLANGIAESLPELIPTIIDVILQIVETLTDPQNLSNLLDAALNIILELAWGLVDAIPNLVGAVLKIIYGIQGFLTNPENLIKLVEAAVEIVLAIATGIVNSIPVLIESFVGMVKSLVDTMLNTDWEQVAKDALNSLWAGLEKAWESIKNWFSGVWNNLFGGRSVKIDANTGELVSSDSGSSDQKANISKGSGNYVYTPSSSTIPKNTKASQEINTVSGSGAKSSPQINITQNIYSKSQSAADLVSETIYQQRRAVASGVQPTVRF